MVRMRTRSALSFSNLNGMEWKERGEWNGKKGVSGGKMGLGEGERERTEGSSMASTPPTVYVLFSWLRIPSMGSLIVRG